MFGYVVADPNQLSDSEKQTYRSFYCGLCHAIGKRFGTPYRVTLTYDMTFLALFLSSLLDVEMTAHTARCFIHPGRGQRYISNKYIDYAADMNILLSYEKMMDDYHDDHSIVKYWGAEILEKKLQDVPSYLFEKRNKVHTLLNELFACETKRGNLDESSFFFAEIMSVIFSHPDIPNCFIRDVQNFAKALGRFIFLLDAYCDFHDDMKKIRYNPLLYQEGIVAEASKIKELLVLFIGEATEIFEKLPIIDNVSILRNILYCGIWDKYEIQRTKEKKK